MKEIKATTEIITVGDIERGDILVAQFTVVEVVDVLEVVQTDFTSRYIHMIDLEAQDGKEEWFKHGNEEEVERVVFFEQQVSYSTEKIENELLGYGWTYKAMSPDDWTHWFKYDKEGFVQSSCAVPPQSVVNSNHEVVNYIASAISTFAPSTATKEYILAEMES